MRNDVKSKGHHRLFELVMLYLAIIGCTHNPPQTVDTPEGGSGTKPGVEQSIPLTLPSGFVAVQSPVDKQLCYAHSVTSGIPTKPTGDLLRSTDGGRSWKSVYRIGPYLHTHLHVNGVTGELFAAIDYHELRENRSEFVVSSARCRVLHSTDGENWKDITPRVDFIPRSGSFRGDDPEHPNRVVVSLGRGMGHGCVCYALNDEMSEWRFEEE